MCNTCDHDIGGSGECSACTVARMAESARQVSDNDVLVLDTTKYKFFWEQCCDCGLVHKTHVRVNGTRVYLRHERRDAPPTSDQIAKADIISVAAMCRILGSRGGRARVKKGFADPRVQAKAQATRQRKARDGQNAANQTRSEAE